MSEKYNAAYINALSEERDPTLLFEWIVKLHRENVDFRREVARLGGIILEKEEEIDDLHRQLAYDDL